MALLVFSQPLIELIQPDLGRGLQLKLSLPQPPDRQDRSHQRGDQQTQQQSSQQQQRALFHVAQISCSSAHSSSVIIFSRSTRMSSSSFLLLTPWMNLADSSVPTLGAVSMSDWRRYTTSATLSTRMPITCRSAAMMTTRAWSVTGAGLRPRRWRVSITVTTLPRRLMMPNT